MSFWRERKNIFKELSDAKKCLRPEIALLTIFYHFEYSINKTFIQKSEKNNSISEVKNLRA